MRSWPAREIGRAFTAYETRPEQEGMARAVEDAASKGRVLLVEAGTGVGKTLAYLVPGIRAARAAGRPLVVATSTINLQTQLVTKDLPLLAREVFPDLRVRLLKGRSNYLCREELALALSGGEGSLFGPGADLERLRAWCDAPGGGSRETLPFDAPEWSDLDCDTPICDRRTCPSFARCFYYGAREGLDTAEVIVTNHHYLLRSIEFPPDGASPAKFREDAIPVPALVVVDEAHDLEASARSVFASDVGTSSLAYALRRLAGARGRGLLPFLAKRLPGAEGILADAARAADGLDARLDFVREDFEKIRAADPAASLPARLRAADPGPYDAVSAACARDLARSSDAVADPLRGVEEILAGREEKAAEADRPSWARLRARTRAARGHFAASAALLRTISGEDPLPARPSVLWIERRVRRARGAAAGSAAGRAEFRWNLAPLEASDRLASLWRGLPAAVLSSATLAVAGRMETARRRAGVPDDRAVAARWGSPFDFARNLRHWVVRGAGPRGGEGEDAHAARLGPILADALRASRGRALVLMTSHGLLARAARAIRPACAAAGIHVLVQGEEGRESLLARFTAGPPAALLATDSFRQGVDLPGAQLSLVVLARLPFAVPTDPLEAARAEAARSEGRDYFREVALPDAVLKFRQGFGRLLRTATDRGVVLTLDDRILSKSYGRAFLDSLPADVRTEPIEPAEVAARIGEVLGQSP